MPEVEAGINFSGSAAAEGPQNIRDMNMGNIFLLMGCIFTGFGLYRLFAYFRFFKRGILVQGKVVDVFSFRNSKGVALHAPVVAYYFEGAQTITGEIGTFFRPKTGKKMIVGINPRNLSQRRLKQNSFVFIHLWISGMGLFFILLFTL